MTYYAEMTIYDEQGNEIVLEISGQYISPQNGGDISPSFGEYIDDIHAYMPDGTLYRMSREEYKYAETILLQKREDVLSDYEGY